MTIINSFAIIALAALVHASFQLSISMLTLLSGHSIGSNHSHARLIRLTTSFVAGVGVMTMLMLSFLSLVFLSLLGPDVPKIIWAASCGLLFSVAISIWLFYYRREKGTTLWVPRGVATYLSERIKLTKLSAESFSLGLVSVLGELLFVITPLIVTSLILIQLPSSWQLIGILVYTLISMSPLMIVWSLISRKYKISSIQRWRESNKYFLQFSAGAGLIVLAFFIFVNEILFKVVG